MPSWRFPILFALAICLVFAGPGSEGLPQEPERISISTHAKGILRHKPGSWSVVGVTARNPTDEAGEAVISTYFAPDVGRQFARRMWVPGRAQRSGWLPFEAPANVPRGTTGLSLTTLTLSETTSGEYLQRGAGDLLTEEMALGLDWEGAKTGLYFDRPLPNERDRGQRDDDDYQLIMAAKTAAHLPQSGTSLGGDFIPPWCDALRGFDQIVLTSDRILRDAAGLASLRAWVRDGGRLWIMLDRVAPATVFAIVGHAHHIEIVDRAELDRYSLETTATWDRKANSELCEYEAPVEFLRVVTSSSDVSCRVNDWPAAIWLPCGDGEILFTTLASRGWRSESGKSTAALQDVAARFFATRGKRLDPLILEPALHEQIGYRIPNRSLAALVLTGYCGGLLAAGLLLARVGRLEWLAVAVPALSLLAGGVLVTIGALNTTRVPPTVAAAQLLRLEPATNEVRVEGLGAIYDQRSREISLQGEQRGWVISRSPGDDGEVRRHVWIANEAMHTQNVSTFAGSVSLASFVNVRGMGQPVSARAQFGPSGLEGRLATGDLQGVSDLVIVAPPAPSLALQVASDGTFTAGANQVLAAEQFTSEILLTDEQRRRQEVCRRLFDPTDDVRLPRQPTLLFWCHAMKAGISFPAEFDVIESALATLPLEIERTPPASPFQVPATFLPVVVAPGKQGRSGVYEARTGQWTKKVSKPTETVLRFQLPVQVLPCRLGRGDLAIRVNAPSRDLRLWSYPGGEPVQVGFAASPNAVLHFELGPQHLPLDEQGGVRLGVTVGESRVATDSTADSSTWQIDYVRLTLEGQTL